MACVFAELRDKPKADELDHGQRLALLLAVPPNNLVARIVRDNKAGLASSSYGMEEFIANALRLMNDQTYREELASRGRRYAEQTFDIGRITDKFENLFANRLRTT